MKNVLVLNDISGLGNCSLSANLPVLTALKHNVLPIATSLFSCQTGFENFRFQRNGEFALFAEDILDKITVDALYVGFCLDKELLKAAASLVSRLKCSGTFVLVDPIMGDNGWLYPVFDTGYVDVMKTVTKGADCITPNLTEACLLGSVDYFELTAHKDEDMYLLRCAKAFSGLLEATGALSAVVTGVDFKNYVGNILLGEQTGFVTGERSEINFSGTGDLFSSVVLGKLLNGSDLLDAAEKAAAFVYRAVVNTQNADRRMGVEFCRVLDTLK